MENLKTYKVKNLRSGKTETIEASTVNQAIFASLATNQSINDNFYYNQIDDSLRYETGRVLRGTDYVSISM